MKVSGRTLLFFVALILVVAILRFFLKGWVEPLGVSDKAGSFLVSITIATFIGLIILFVREGRAAEGSYWRGVGGFAILAVWSQAIIFAGIMIAAKTGAATYYDEMMGKHLAMPPLQHGISHLIVSVPEVIVGAILGGIIYLIAKRGRAAAAAAQ
ncbi:MAG: hypothetical protein ACM3NO_02380 [Deltaproteobacteria bacterium]